MSQLKRAIDNDPITRKSSVSHFTVVLISSTIATFAITYLNLANWISLTVPFMTIVYFALWAFRVDRVDRDVDSLNHHSEQIYLLGYILTLVAIFGTLCSPNLSDLGGLLQLAGLKLLASLCGISAMLILKEVSHQWESDQTNKQDLFERTIGQRISLFDQDLEALSGKIKAVEAVVNVSFFEETAEVMKRFQNTIKDSSKKVGKSVDEIATLCSSQHTQLTEISERFADVLEEFRGVHKNQITKLNDDFEELQKDFVDATSSNLGLVSEANEKAFQQLTLFYSEMKVSLNQTAEEITDQFKQCERISNHFTEMVTKLEKIGGKFSEESDSSIVSGIISFAATLENANSSLEKITSLEEKTIDVTRRQLELYSDHNKAIESASNASSDHRESLAELNQALRVITQDFTEKQSKMLDTAAHIQKMAERIESIGGSRPSQIKDSSKDSDNTRRGFFGRK